VIIVRNGKTIEIENLPREYASVIKQRLRLSDPAYWRMKATGAPMYGMEEFFKYYKEVNGVLTVPKGFRKVLLKFLDKYGLEYEEQINKVTKKRVDPIIGKVLLRDYQVPIIPKMQENREGVVKMSTGSGKSIVSLEFIVRSGLCGTIIVKDKTLLHQIADECTKFWGYTPGLIGDGHRVIKDITIATVQTLHSDTKLLEELAEQTGVLIVDEIQEFVSDLRVEVIESFAPSYFFGVTATPYRSESDGRTKAVSMIFGETIHSYTSESMKPTVRVYASGFKDIPVRAKYSDMVKTMITHKGRNNLIAGLATAEIITGKKVLILTRRVLHAELLYCIMGHIGTVYHIEADSKGKKELLAGFKRGDVPYSCIIGTVALLGTGFDVPTLDRVIIAGDMRSNVLTAQSVGRITRLMNGKSPEVIDICDDKNGMLLAQYKSRKKVYKSNGWDIVYHPEYIKKWL